MGKKEDSRESYFQVLASRKRQGLLLKLYSLVILVLVWQAGHISAPYLNVPPELIPGPYETVRALVDNLMRGELAFHLKATMIRVISSFVLVMVVGTGIGVIMGLFWRAEAALDLWIMVALTVPGLCYVIISFMWFGLNEFSAVVAISVTTVPSTIINIWEGVKDIDNKLVDMAKVFRTSPAKRLRRVIFPQILPYVMASSRFGLGIIWKVTVLVELLGRSSGVGFMLNYWWQLYDMTQVLAWTMLFTFIMLFLELVVLKQVEAKVFRWRPAIRF